MKKKAIKWILSVVLIGLALWGVYYLNLYAEGETPAQLEKEQELEAQSERSRQILKEDFQWYEDLRDSIFPPVRANQAPITK